jgi:hypothetical protein
MPGSDARQGDEFGAVTKEKMHRRHAPSALSEPFLRSKNSVVTADYCSNSSFSTSDSDSHTAT